AVEPDGYRFVRSRPDYGAARHRSGPSGRVDDAEPDTRRNRHCRTPFRVAGEAGPGWSDYRPRDGYVHSTRFYRQRRCAGRDLPHQSHVPFIDARRCASRPVRDARGRIAAYGTGTARRLVEPDDPPVCVSKELPVKFILLLAAAFG